MARPRKWRKVCSLPENNRYGPLGVQANKREFIAMLVDEYETIRLIDLEGFTQEECSDQMHIARTTVQRIYSDARKKIAQSLVEGKVLVIEGGDYKLCNEAGESCNLPHCGRHRHGHGRSIL